MIRAILIALALAVAPMQAALAQEVPSDEPRAETGGAQTLEDILRRQQGLEVDPTFRAEATGDPEAAAPSTSPLGTLGGQSDPELWRALRYGTANVSSQVRSPGATLLVQDDGMWWLQFREGPLRTWGGYFLLGVLALLALFYLIRGRIRIDHGKSGVKITRFRAFERFSHWLLAGSFILLGVTGLVSLFGRVGMMPWMGREGYAMLALWSKWIHNNVSWAFMLGLVFVFVLWVWHNLPDRTDLTWFAKGGGIFMKGHPAAKKFNAGQKLIFWSVILLGASISVSGLSLLFPFDMPIFASTFHHINTLGLPELVGREPLPEVLTPHAEMQYAQLWHSIIAFVLMGIVLAHIYIGTLGMEGAYDAMGSGEVDLNWAKEHHSLWVEEKQASDGEAPPTATPAE